MIISKGFVKSETINSGLTSVITFHHPQSNSLPGEILTKLAEEINSAGNQSEVRTIIIRSEGDKAFCAGASFDELISIRSFEDGVRFFSGFAHVINAIRSNPKLVLIRVHNKAVGGGVGIAAAGDYTFATTNASVKLSELAVGIGPFVVGPAVERKVGKSGFQQLAINATEWKSAEWANSRGLFNELFENENAMDKALDSLVFNLNKSNPEAMENIKRVSWEGTENWDKLLLERAGISGKLVLSEFTQKAINAFKSKT